MDAEAYPQEVLAEEEPNYLRRQKPLEIKRRKFGRKAWKTYLRVAGWALVGLAGAWMAYACGHFLFASPEMALIHPEQVAIKGIDGAHTLRSPGQSARSFRRRSRSQRPAHSARYAPSAARGDSVGRAGHRAPRVAKPIEVEITERTPIAFLRQGSELALVDVHGVILDRPVKGNFHFPVVTGISAEMASGRSRETHAAFCRLCRSRLQAARAGAMEQVSEVDLSDANDLRATVTGFRAEYLGKRLRGRADAPMLVHFGDSDFEGKYRTLLENIAQWRATAGRVESVDLRFSREAVVNPDTSAMALKQAPAHAAPGSAVKHSR